MRGTTQERSQRIENRDSDFLELSGVARFWPDRATTKKKVDGDDSFFLKNRASCCVRTCLDKKNYDAKKHGSSG